MFEPEKEEDGSKIIVAILGRRLRTGRSNGGASSSTAITKSFAFRPDRGALDAKYDHEYLIKYKDLSYRKCEWLTATDIDAMSIRSKTALSRYLTKIDKGDSNVQEDGEIDPTWMEIEKVLDVREEEVAEIVDGNFDENASKKDDIDVDDDVKKEHVLSLASQSSFASQISETNDDDDIEVESSSSDEDGEKKIKTATQVFMHEQRCRKLLERIWDDPFAVSFVDPVNTNVFEDYLDIIEEPMSLSEVKEKLDNGEYKRYNYHIKFMNDLRLIWRNCKTYNLYKSQIWHSAHTLSMMSERLFQAWVLAYQDGCIEMKDSLGQPWETTCRTCTKDVDENKVILCDHCDAPFHIYCLRPKLEEVPEGSWMCTRCVRFFQKCEKSNKMGIKVLTATAEDEARTNTENAGIRRVIQVRKKKYLVKWRGLSYRECTWELPADIGDDSIIQGYHTLNDAPPDEPPLTRAELDAELRKDRAKPMELVKFVGNHYNPCWDVEAEVYAQIRAFHFLKWDLQPPAALLKECGPESFAYTYGRRTDLTLPSKLKEKIDTIRATKVEELPPSTDDKDTSPKPNKKKKKEKEKEKEEEVKPPAPVEPLPKDSDDVPAYCFFPMKSKVDNLVDISVAGSSSSSKSSKSSARELDVCHDKAEIAEHLSVMIASICRAQNISTTPKIKPVYTSRPKLPKSNRCPSEVEYCMKKGNAKLGIRVANYYGRIIVVGFHRYGPHKVHHPLGNFVKQGDILTAINGVSITDLQFKDALNLLYETKTPYIHMRFLRTLDRSGPEGAKDREALRKRQQENDPDSMKSENDMESGANNDEEDDPELDVVNRYLNRKRDEVPSYRLPILRSLYQGVFPTDDGRWDASYHLYKPDKSRDNSKDGYGTYKHVGTFDDELTAAKKRDKEMREHLPAKGKRLVSGESLIEKLNFEGNGITLSEASQARFRIVTEERQKRDELLSTIQDRDVIYSSLKSPDVDKGASPTKATLTPDDNEGQPSSNTKATADSPSGNLGESPKKDDALEEDDDELYSLDSRDSDSEAYPESELSSSDESEESSDDEWDEDENGEWKSKKKIMQEQDQEIDGPSSRLLRAVNEVEMPPIQSDWEKYILEDYRKKTKQELEEEAAERIRIANLPVQKPVVSNAKQVDQLDMKTGEVIATHPSVTAGALAVGCSTTLLHETLSGKKPHAGGFHWRESKKAEEAAVAEMMKILDADLDGDDQGDDDADPNKPGRKKRDMSWTKSLYKKSREYKTPGNKLRDYQLEGVNWLLRCFYQKKSSILADEMGLGKTVQIVTFFEHLFDVEGMRGPFLVCVPLSTIGHWSREFENWSKMQVNVYHDTGGGRDMRDIIREFEWYYKGRSRRLLKFQTLICTYDDLIRDYEELAEIPWRAVVVDEAHRLRNVNSKLLECMRQVLQKGSLAYGYQHRVLLTGTPLQNNTAELWSLLNFIEPAKFPDADKFQIKFGNIQTESQVVSLQKRLAPHLLRRVKEDVAKDIPLKEETIIDVELTTIQKQYYRAIFEHNHGFLMQQMKGHMPKLMNIQMELRKCCNHPYLVNGVEELEESQLDAKLYEEARAAGKAGDYNHGLSKQAKRKAADDEYVKRRMEENIIPTSGKMVLLDKLLPKLRKEGHKVLIFSQMVRMLDIIGQFCDFRNYPNERLDGRVSGNDRQKGIDRFNKNEDSFIFLLSTRAGGVGINLTAADTVIIFDSDWNPQNDVQAMARCHRIGQTKQVTIYRLITRRSFEAEMFDRASRKLGLETAVLGTRKFTDNEEEDGKEKKIDSKEMELLLKEGAYAVLLDDDETQNDMKEFYEGDIDSILASRAHVHVTEGGQKTESWLNKKKKSRVRKTKFKDDGKDGLMADVDVNDPDFWSKVLPDLVTPDSLLTRMDIMNEENEENKFDKKKFVKDLHSMMDGVLDLSMRGTLPDRDRQICMDLLLRFSLNEQIFTEKERVKANEWLGIIEGTRNRRNRVDLNGKGGGTSSAGRGHDTHSGFRTYDGDHDADIYGDLESGSDDSEGSLRGESDDSTKKGKRGRKKGGRGPDRKPRRGGGAGSRGGKGSYGKRPPPEPRYDNEGNLIYEEDVEPPKKRGRKKKEVDPNIPKPKRSHHKKKEKGDLSAPPTKRKKFSNTPGADQFNYFSDASDDVKGSQKTDDPSSAGVAYL
jgi:SNF2 family DNA or RNA helicase